MTPTHLLYLHGFRSSPQSMKARLMAQYMAAQHPNTLWWCPQLPPSPREAVEMLREGVKSWPSESMAVVGSSLGGFYATYLAEKLGCKAALLNPAVDPARDLAQYIGAQRSWHDADERFFFKPEFIQELRDLTLAQLTQPARYFALIAKGDEVLDWREMAARYAGAHLQLLEGGDHAISDFEVHLPQVVQFLGFTPADT